MDIYIILKINRHKNMADAVFGKLFLIDCIKPIGFVIAAIVFAAAAYDEWLNFYGLFLAYFIGPIVIFILSKVFKGWDKLKLAAIIWRILDFVFIIVLFIWYLADYFSPAMDYFDWLNGGAQFAYILYLIVFIIYLVYECFAMFLTVKLIKASGFK